MSTSLLEVRDLDTRVGTGAREVRAVRGLSFSVGRGEIVSLVGESGCGKSITALSVLRLLPPQARIAGGTILFDGRDLGALSEAEMRKMRGDRIGMIFQEPMTSLNPVKRIGAQIAEPLRLHKNLSGLALRRRAIELLQLVRMPAAERRIDEWPHQLSGGMRQRVMIAMAMACEPDLIIADEPTTALDVTVQAQILDLLTGLCQERGTALLLITHDLAVVSEVADRVVVMYGGREVETGRADVVFAHPKHPYTAGLVAARPGGSAGTRERLIEIPGTVPVFRADDPGCGFRARCMLASPRCEGMPPRRFSPDGAFACWEAPSC